MKTALVIASMLVAGCAGGGSSGTQGATQGGAQGVAPTPTELKATCGDSDTSVVEGTLEGSPVDATGETIWSVFVSTDPFKYDGKYDGGGVHLVWDGSTPDGQIAALTGAAIFIEANPPVTRTFRSGLVVHESSGNETILKTSMTFDTGTVTVCIRKTR